MYGGCCAFDWEVDEVPDRVGYADYMTAPEKYRTTKNLTNSQALTLAPFPRTI